MSLHDRAVVIIANLKKNGGPLATEAAILIKDLIKEIPKKEKGELHPYHRRIILLTQKRINKLPRDKKETRAFNNILSQIDEEDLIDLEYLYSQPENKKFHKQLSCRKTQPIFIINNFRTQADIAKAFRIENKSRFETKHKIPEPVNWQQRAPGNLGSFSWELICKQYPDISESLKDPLKDLSKAFNGE